MPTRSSSRKKSKSENGKPSTLSPSSCTRRKSYLNSSWHPSTRNRHKSISDLQRNSTNIKKSSKGKQPKSRNSEPRLAGKVCNSINIGIAGVLTDDKEFKMKAKAE